ncbi:MAG: T9SS type A sorting domain-containing protein [Ignavibacteria bacterium]|nr:T9SS type A sorting domain-containing protein [Ignavibacteria bacterium]
MKILTLLFCFGCLTHSLFSQAIPATRLLHLSEYNLAKIGVRVTDKGVTFIENVQPENSTSPKRKILLTKNAVSVSIAKKKDLSDVREFAPVFAVNTFKSGSAAFYRTINDTKKFTYPDSLLSGNSTKIINADWANKLVCVVVEFTPKVKNSGKNIVYLWYEPTNTFIDALPIEIAEPIWSETLLADKGILASAEGNFTDSWRSTSELITSIVYPNPVQSSSATVEFTLNSPTSLTIALYDISGNRIREFYPKTSYPEGKQILELPLTSITNGMYFVTIIAENRQPVVQRLLIAR